MSTIFQSCQDRANGFWVSTSTMGSCTRTKTGKSGVQEILVWSPLLYHLANEGLVGQPTICIGKTKMQISFAFTAKLIRAFVFTTRIVQFLSYLNTKFQASSPFLWLYSPVCVGPVWKPHCWFPTRWLKSYVFSHLSISTCMYCRVFFGMRPREFPQKYTQSSSGLTRDTSTVTDQHNTTYFKFRNHENSDLIFSFKK